MRILNNFLLFCFVVVFQSSLFSQNAFLEDYHAPSGMAIGAKITSFGPGIEISAALNRSFALRTGVAFYSYRYNEDINTGDGTARNARTNLGAVTLGLDWMFVRFLHLSAGVIYNFSEIKFDVVPTTPDAQNNGVVSYQIKPHQYGPYFALGFGRSISKKRIVSVGFDVGLTYQGESLVEHQVTGTISDRKLSKWNYNVTSNTKFYKVYPIISLMITFRLF